MLCVNKDQMIVEGDSHLVCTEVACLLSTIRENDQGAIPVILSCLYSDGGKLSLSDTLKEFKKDTTATLERLQEIEEMKNGR